MKRGALSSRPPARFSLVVDPHDTVATTAGSMTDADDSLFTTIAVECYAGSRGEETPRRFGTPGAQVEVAEIVDRWLAPDHRYFKVRDQEGALYILRHDVITQLWELRFFRRSAEPE